MLRTAAVILAIALLVLAFCLLLKSCQKQDASAAAEPELSGAAIYAPREAPKEEGFELDDRATEGGWEPEDTEAIIADLNEKVEQGMINISMNTAPVFENGQAEGSLMIVNESINRYPQIVEIVRNDTGEIIYRSKGIPVGSKIESAKLDAVLPKGEYECTAFFYNVDPNTGYTLGCAGAVIKITVQS